MTVLLDLLNLAGSMDGSQAYTLRKPGMTIIWDSYRPQHGGQH